MKTLIDWLGTWCRETPHAPAWWYEQAGQLHFLTWLDVARHVLLLSSKLTGKQGDRVLSYLPNGLDWVTVDLACQLTGLIHVPVDFRIPRPSVATYERLVRPVHVFAPERTPVRLAGLHGLPHRLSHTAEDLGSTQNEIVDRLLLARPTDPAAPATILFTSGTSGRPRGVMLSHLNLAHNALGKLDAVPQATTDRRLNLLPFSHAYARTCELSTWLCSGSSMLCVPSLADVFRLAPVFQPTLMNAVPYLFAKLREAIEGEATGSENRFINAEPSLPKPPILLSSHATHLSFPRIETEKGRQSLSRLLGERLRVLAAGGAGLSQDLFLWFANLGLPIIQGYGLTEASPVVCSNRSDNPQGDCVGPAIRDTELHIDAEERLWVKGPGVMLGYWEDNAATKKRIIDGWLDTGDRAAWTSAGAIRILGRCDDRIVLSTGEKVDPSVIEDGMLQLPAIRRALLIGHQQKFLAAIVISETADESLLLNQIQLHLRDLPRYCIPKRLIIVKDDWTHEAGLVNHKGTIIRSAILDKYRLEIGRLFHASLGRRQDTLDPCQTEQQADPQHQQRDGVQQ